MARGTREPLCYCRFVRPVDRPCARSPPAEKHSARHGFEREPDHGEQEMSVWNGHYACTCYHPLFVFNQFGDLERCALRPGNVQFQLHALAYNLGNFLRTLATSEPIKDWSLTT